MIRTAIPIVLSTLALVTLFLWFLDLPTKVSWELTDTNDAFRVVYCARGEIGYYWIRFAKPDYSQIPWTKRQYSDFRESTKERQRNGDGRFQGFYLATGLSLWLVPGLMEGQGYSFPLWLATIVFSVYPSIVFILMPLYRTHRCHHRRRRGLCVQCGYDLTGNVSGRCPECGQAIRYVR